MAERCETWLERRLRLAEQDMKRWRAWGEANPDQICPTCHGTGQSPHPDRESNRG